MIEEAQTEILAFSGRSIRDWWNRAGYDLVIAKYKYKDTEFNNVGEQLVCEFFEPKTLRQGLPPEKVRFSQPD